MCTAYLKRFCWSVCTKENNKIFAALIVFVNNVWKVTRKNYICFSICFNFGVCQYRSLLVLSYYWTILFLFSLWAAGWIGTKFQNQPVVKILKSIKSFCNLRCTLYCFFDVEFFRSFNLTIVSIFLKSYMMVLLSVHVALQEINRKMNIK